MKLIKIIILCCVVFIVSCRKIEIIPTPAPTTDLFKTKEVNVTNGSNFEYNLVKSGSYTLTMIDTISTQVVSREKIAGKIGINNLTIYTKTLQSKYLYLILRDSVDNQLGKTLLILN